MSGAAWMKAMYLICTGMVSFLDRSIAANEVRSKAQAVLVKLYIARCRLMAQRIRGGDRPFGIAV
jgi:hypothetical protein